MKPTLLIIIFLFTAIYTSGQGICNDVIANAGNFESGASGSIAWTLGEPVSETVTSASNIVTQGFHQTNCCPVITAIGENEISDLLVYPNPASQKITIDFGKSPEGHYKITLTDLQGRNMIAGIFHHDKEASVFYMDLIHYAAGIYLLNIQNIATGTSNIYRINKIN